MFLCFLRPNRIFSMNKQREKRFGTVFSRRPRRVPRLVRSVADKAMNLKVWEVWTLCVVIQPWPWWWLVCIVIKNPLPFRNNWRLIRLFDGQKKIPGTKARKCLEVGFTKIIKDRVISFRFSLELMTETTLVRFKKSNQKRSIRSELFRFEQRACHTRGMIRCLLLWMKWVRLG